MKMTFQKLVISASIAIGVSAFVTAPAQAGTLTGATIGGTAASDYLVYDSNATNTFTVVYLLSYQDENCFTNGNYLTVSFSIT